MMTLLGSEWQHHMHLFCLDFCPEGRDPEVSIIEAMVILETLLGCSIDDVAKLVACTSGSSIVLARGVQCLRGVHSAIIL
jgi:hypothetical protein